MPPAKTIKYIHESIFTSPSESTFWGLSPVVLSTNESCGGSSDVPPVSPFCTRSLSRFFSFSISCARSSMSPVPILPKCWRCWSRAVRNASHVTRCLPCCEDPHQSRHQAMFKPCLPLRVSIPVHHCWLAAQLEVRRWTPSELLLAQTQRVSILEKTKVLSQASVEAKDVGVQYPSLRTMELPQVSWHCFPPPERLLEPQQPLPVLVRSSQLAWPTVASAFRFEHRSA